MRAYHPRIIRQCRFLLADPILGEDAAQEVFVKAYLKLHSFRAESSFGTWLSRIAVHHCTDLLRQKKPLVPFEEETASPANFSREMESGFLLSSLLSSLPEESRTMLVLREIEGMSYEEIGKVMGCSIDSVKGRLKRGRQILEEKARKT